MNNYNQWCIVSVPTDAWAGKIFPELSKKKARKKTMETYFFNSES